MSEIRFLKVRAVKSPERGHDYDAGIDFFVPTFDQKFIRYLIDKNQQLFKEAVDTLNEDTFFTTRFLTLFGNDAEKGPYFTVPPQNRVMIPSGIQSRMAAPGRALIGANKSGIATRYGLVYGAHVIDYLYQGEIHISVINTSDMPVKIFEGQKLMQFIEMPVINSVIEVVDGTDDEPAQIDFWRDFSSSRGQAGFGSTGGR